MSSDPTPKDILEELTEGVVAVNFEGTVTLFNHGAEKITERSRGQVIGKKLVDSLPSFSRLVELLDLTISEGRLFAEYEEKVRRPFSGEIPVSITTSLITSSDGTVSGAVAIIKDLSGIKSLEAGSLRKERLAYIGTFASSLAHELKNPLSGIRGAAQLLKRKIAKGATEDTLTPYMDAIVKEADRLNLILNEMLDFSRPRELKMTRLNIHKVLNDVAILAQTSGEGAAKGVEEGEWGEVQIIKEYDPSLPDIRVDEDLLKQVFLNLVKNGMEATLSSPDGYLEGSGGGGDRKSPGSGRAPIRIRTRMVTDFHMILDGEPGGGEGAGDTVGEATGTQAGQTPQPPQPPTKQMLAVEVIDGGGGIRDEDLEKIFTPFFTTKPKGSGLGLAVSLKIIKEHGGMLKVDSVPGSGTTMKVYLPIK